jgi:unsaturated chondroitin disaccharide hydrolase
MDVRYIFNMNTVFDHEKLNIYQQSIRFVCWADELLQYSSRPLSVFTSCVAVFSLVLCVFMAMPVTSYAGEDGAIDIDHVMRVAARKLARYDAAHPVARQYPTDAKGDAWTTVPPTDWVSGFYPGALWYVYEYARENKWPDQEEWLARADKWTRGLEQQQFLTANHDIGFIIFDSYGNGYRITGNPDYKPVILQAAKTATRRYRDETRMIRSWGKKNDMRDFIVIIDNMMNLELLMWAANNGGDKRLREIAINHANRTMELFFRPDHSTYHVVHLDPQTGETRRKRTQQGKSTDSTWSRGQGWAISGFAYMYEVTRDPKYLETSRKALDYYLERLPDDQVPPSDFDSTLEGLEFKDSSTAPLVAAALLRLHDLVDAPELKEKYLQTARKMLKALTRPPYFSEGDDKASILVYAARNYTPKPDDRLTNTSLIWGDFYLLQALLRYQRITAGE